VPCCALAAFLIGQIWVFVSALRSALRLRAGSPADEVFLAAAWRPARVAALATVPAPRLRTRYIPLLLFGVLEVSILGGVVAGLAHHFSRDAATTHVLAMLENPLTWCRSKLVDRQHR
jgi:hypothetical protein